MTYSQSPQVQRKQSAQESDLLRNIISRIDKAENWQDVLAFLHYVQRSKVRVKCISIDGDRPIVQVGNPSSLYLIISGNAYIYMPYVANRSKSLGQKVDVAGLQREGLIHPLILQEGDFIGEFEVWDGSPFVASVIAGLPFRIPGRSRTRQETARRTQLLEIPAEKIQSSGTCMEVISRKISKKVIAMNCLMLILRSKPEEKLDQAVPYFFSGVLPVLRYWVKSEQQKSEQEKLESKKPFVFGDEGTDLGTAAEIERIRGVEITTTFLERLLGITNVKRGLDGVVVHRGVYWRRKSSGLLLKDGQAVMEDGKPKYGEKLEEAGGFDRNTEAGELKPSDAESVLLFLKRDLGAKKYLSGLNILG